MLYLFFQLNHCYKGFIFKTLQMKRMNIGYLKHHKIQQRKSQSFIIDLKQGELLKCLQFLQPYGRKPDKNNTEGFEPGDSV